MNANNCVLLLRKAFLQQSAGEVQIDDFALLILQFAVIPQGEVSMELFLQLFITGILVGRIYALVALGWTLLYKCSGVVNLAMEELPLMGAHVCLTMYQWHIPFVFALLITLVIGFVLGILTEVLF